LGVPDVDDTDLDTTRGPGGGSGGGAAYVAGDDRTGGHMQMSSRVSFGGFDASSIMMGTVRDSTQPRQPTVELDFLAFLGIARLMLTVRAWLCAACAPGADVDVKQSDTVSLLGERCGRSHATECCRPHDQVRASSATRCHAAMHGQDLTSEPRCCCCCYRHTCLLADTQSCLALRLRL